MRHNRHGSLTSQPPVNHGTTKESPDFHCRRHEFNPWSGKWDPTCQFSVAKNNNNNNNKIYTENQETHMCILNLLSTTCIDSGCFFPLLFWSFLCSLIYKLRQKKKKLISVNREDDWTTLYVDIIFSGKALFEEMVEHTSWMAWSKVFITWTSSIMSHLDLYFYLLKI